MGVERRGTLQSCFEGNRLEGGVEARTQVSRYATCRMMAPPTEIRGKEQQVWGGGCQVCSQLGTFETWGPPTGFLCAVER